MEIAIGIISLIATAVGVYIAYIQLKRTPKHPTDSELKLRENVEDSKRVDFANNSSVLELLPVDKVLTSLGNASSNGAGLRICNNSDFDVLECFGTLEDLRCVYIDNNNLLEDSSPSHLQLGLRVSGKLRWANKGLTDGECKIDIPARSKENILLVLNLVIETRVIKKGKRKEFARDNQRYFSVPYCFLENENRIAPGLFKVRVRLNGKSAKSNEVPSITAYYEGYVYCYHKEAPFGIGTGLYWSQNPLNDQRIMNDVKLSKRYYEKEI